MLARSDDAQILNARSDASRRLTLLKHVAADHVVLPTDFKIFYVIWIHINSRTGIAFISDDVIQEFVPVDLRTIRRARRKLREQGWLSWSKSGAANAYKLAYDRIPEVSKKIAKRRDDRLERRAAEKGERTSMSASPDIERTSMSGLPEEDRTSVSDERTSVSDVRASMSTGRTPAPPILISSNSDINSGVPIESSSAAPLPSLFPHETRGERLEAKQRRRVRNQLTDLPANYVISDRVWKCGTNLSFAGPFIESEVQKAKLWAEQNGKRYASWDAFFESWLRRAAEYASSKPRSATDGFDDFRNGGRHG